LNRWLLLGDNYPDRPVKIIVAGQAAQVAPTNVRQTHQSCIIFSLPQRGATKQRSVELGNLFYP
jgi:hypothetical protein